MKINKQWIILLLIFMSFELFGENVRTRPMELERAIVKMQYDAIPGYAYRLRSQGEDLGMEVLFYEGEAYYYTKQYGRAIKKLMEYLDKTKTSGQSYFNAMEYLNTIWDRRYQRTSNERNRILNRLENITIKQNRLSDSVGRIGKINAEWGYLIIDSVSELEVGKTYFVYIGNDLLPLNIKKKSKQANSYTANASKDDLGRLQTGMLVIR